MLLLQSRVTSQSQLLSLALVVYVVLPTVCPVNSFPITNSHPNTKSKKDSSDTNCQKQSIFNLIKLWLSGDVHQNPGPTQYFNICHINCRSFNIEKKPLIAAEAPNFDVLTMSETWFKQNHTHTDLSGFHKPIRHDRPGDVGYGGVAIYIKDSHYCKHRPDLQVDGLEAVWAETRINRDVYLIGSFYRPPNSPVNYWNLISESIFKANSSNGKIIILGDFNSDFNNPSQHLVNIMDRYQLFQLTNENTRITDTTRSCLSLIFTQSKDFVERVEVLPEICSDHCVPCLSVKNPLQQNNSFRRTFYKYNQLRIDDFKTLLANTNLNEILNNPFIDIHTCAERFCKIFFDLACKCMPSKSVKIRTRDKPWMTDELRTAFKRRYGLFKRAKRTDDPTDWANYRTFRNTCTTKTRQRKNEYDQELDNKISNNNNFGTKEFYKLVKSFFF